MPIHMMNIRAEFHRNPSTVYGYMVARERGINGKLATDGRTGERLTTLQPQGIIAVRHVSSYIAC